MRTPPLIEPHDSPEQRESDLDRLLDLEEENERLHRQLARLGSSRMDRLVEALDAYLEWVDAPNPSMPASEQAAVRRTLRFMLDGARGSVR